MTNKKLSKKTYKILETEGTHTVASKDTRGTTRGLEFKDGTNKLVGPVELVEVETTEPKRYEDFSIAEQLIIDVAEIIVPKITDYLSDKAILSFDNWLKNRRKEYKKKKSMKKESLVRRKTKAEQILENQNLESTGSVRSESRILSTDFDFVYEEYRINMTSEEVQKELIDIFMLEVIRAKKIWKVAHANIVDAKDSDGVNLNGKVLIVKLSSPEVLSSINALLQSKPELLDEWETMALSNILGRSVVKDGRYVPIESDSFRNALTLSRQ